MCPLVPCARTSISRGAWRRDLSGSGCPAVVGGPEIQESSEDSTGGVTTKTFDRLLADTCRAGHCMNSGEKVAFLHKLDHPGLFYVRRAADVVAPMLGVSRATIYSWLKNSGDAPDEMQGQRPRGDTCREHRSQDRTHAKRLAVSFAPPWLALDSS